MSTAAPLAPVCGARNGSYTCQCESVPHDGMHYAYYISAGRVRLATWVDQYSKIVMRKAPGPALRRPWKGL